MEFGGGHDVMGDALGVKEVFWLYIFNDSLKLTLSVLNLFFDALITVYTPATSPSTESVSVTVSPGDGMLVSAELALASVVPDG